MHRTHAERHSVEHIAWLRAAVLGANDGLVSTASLVVGVAAADASLQAVLVAGVAGMMAGAMSMAAGEYVSVSSQADAENANLAKERRELIEQPELELKELTDIFISRGLSPKTAKQAAIELTEKDALAAHAREELGITEITTARPLQAAVTSAITFMVGAILPLLVTLAVPQDQIIAAVGASCLVFLAVLGALGAKVGGANPLKAAMRVTFWGAAALVVTALTGHLFGVAV